MAMTLSEASKLPAKRKEDKRAKPHTGGHKDHHINLIGRAFGPPDAAAPGGGGIGG